MAQHINKIEALSYIRTSSMANVGTDKDSAKRQRAAIHAYAKSVGYHIAAEYEDAGVSGTDAIEARKGFAAMLAHIASNGIRVIIVSDASRLARDLMVQEAAYQGLQKLNVKLIAADSPDSFTDTGPTSTLLRQILGSVSQFEKAGLVAKLRGARQRKKAINGKCEGCKSYIERSLDMVTLAKKLSKKGLSLRLIAAELETSGYVQKNGKRYAAAAVMRMIKQFEINNKVKKQGGLT